MISSYIICCVVDTRLPRYTESQKLSFCRVYENEVIPEMAEDLLSQILLQKQFKRPGLPDGT